MKSFFQEFKAFALRGNVLDLAVGVVIGTAFNNIITALVTNIITPPLGLLTGQINFKDLVFSLGGTVKIEYGLFIQALISFLLVAFALFIVIRLINKLNRSAKNDPPEPAPKSAELLVLEEIRDSIKNR